MKKGSGIIALDRDDVLMDLVKGLHSFHNDKYGTKATFEGSYTFDLDVIWGCNEDQVLPRLLEFYQSEYYQNVVPINGAVKAIRFLKEQGYKLVIVTSTHESALANLRKSLGLYFPEYFGENDVYLTHHYNVDGNKKRTKAEICQKLGAQILVDDHIKNLHGCREAGVRGILMRRPWNESLKAKDLMKEGILPAENWDEIIYHIEHREEI